MSQQRIRFLPFILLLGGLISACGGEHASPAEPPFSKPEKPLAAPPKNTVGGFTMQLPEETLMPGEEREVCYLYPLDITGPSHIVGGGYVTVGKGMHHGNITSQPKTGDGVRPCPPSQPGNMGDEVSNILHGGAVLFGSTTQYVGTEWQSFPAGMGFPVRKDQEIVAHMHYLNTSTEPITVAPKYEWFTIDEAKVEHLLGPFIWVRSSFEIPPKSELTAVGGCRFPTGMHIVNLLPHMHALGRAFTAEFMGGALDGQHFLDSPGYDTDGVLVQYRPAIDLSQGDGARFSCTWHNTYDKTIVEGIGDNEMCMAFGYGYPYEDAFSAFTTGPESCVYITLPPLD
jgi:hypothetical protein